MAATAPSDEQRRTALIKAGLDPDLIFRAETVPAPAPRVEDPADQLPKRARTISLERINAPFPEAVRKLTDAEWSLLEGLLPDAPMSSLSHRDWLDLMLRLVVGGESWRSIQGPHSYVIREKYRRERARPQRWQAVEQRVRLLFDDPMRAHLERVCRYVCGDRSGRAKRPDPMFTGTKFGASALPRAAPIAPMRRGSKSWSRNVAPE